MNRKNLPALILLIATAAAITVTGCIFRQSLLRILPLYISLSIALLQSRVNRTAYLIGGLNSIIYAVAYFSMKLYASAAYALLFSCTIQIATWVLWKRRPSGSATVFRVMKNWQRALVGVGFCACLILFATLLRSTDSSFPFLDTAISILGILASLLTMLAFVEYAPLMIVSQVLCIVLYALMLKEDPAQITYLVFASYGLVCQILGFIKVISLKKEQTK